MGGRARQKRKTKNHVTNNWSKYVQWQQMGEKRRKKKKATEKQQIAYKLPERWQKFQMKAHCSVLFIYK